MSVSIGDINRVTMDYFFNRPEVLVQGLMFADARTTRKILREAKRRGIDLGPALRKEFARESVLMQRIGRR